MITIRRINADDNRFEISNIYEQSWKTAYAGIVPQEYLDSIPKGQWASKVDRTGWTTLVCKCDEKLIGTTSVSKSRFKEYPDAGEIISIYLLPEYMHRGYGKELLKAAIDELQGQGFKEIFLWVLEDNVNARRFYEFHGFEQADGKIEVELSGKKLNDIRYRLIQKEN